MAADHLTHILQITLSPVVLISGIGLLLLSMTNRLGRVVDRSRALARECGHSGGGPGNGDKASVQIRILYRRARLLTVAIACAVLAILSVALMVIVLFIGSSGDINVSGVVQALLVSALLALVFSQLFFFADVAVTLRALRLEIAEHIG